MPTAPLDSDLYGDIYGDEFQDFLDDTGDTTAPEGPSSANPDPTTESESKETDDDQPPAPQPMDTTASDNDPALSYSAQIAQQFSVYKQTPSQERQQRAIQHATTRTDSPVGASSDGIFGKKPSEMHDAGKMFIGGLSWDTTDEGLRDYFEQFGKVDACTVMRDPGTGTSRGFAFLTFEDPNSVDTVLKQSHTLDGKSIDPKRAIPREEHLRNTRFFVGGLAHNTTSDSMRAFFSTYGKVVDATVMMDKETGRSKGFGFVTFEDVGTSLNHIVGKIGLVLDDKEIELRNAQARSQRDQTRGLVNKITSNRESTPDRTGTPQSTAHSIPSPFAGMGQMGPMAAMLFNRSMNNFSGMNNGMSLMGLNPMMTLGMGMGGAHQMNAMNGMGGMPNMNMLQQLMSGGMNGMAANPMNMGAMRMGGMGMMGLPNMNPSLQVSGVAMNRGAVGNGHNAVAKQGMQPSFGPARAHGAVRKQPGFHPYSR